MKKFLTGVLMGLFIGWISVPLVKAALVDDDDVRGSHAYKWYLTEMLKEIKDINAHLVNIEDNTRVLRKELTHA